MIKKLRIKFVGIVMAITVLMFGLILGVVLHYAKTNMRIQSVSMMHTIAANPYAMGNLGGSSDHKVRLPFFVVQISSRGELITASGGYFDLSDREYIQKMINLALNSKRESGMLRQYDLRYLKTVSSRGITIVFSDTATEEATLRSLAYSSLLVFFVATVIFFGIAILLSGWVVKPVARAWDQQRQFVADASHELKTPLAVIIANAELMQNESENGKDHAANILDTSYQMRSLVENMLEMARVDNGSVKMDFAQLDFSQLVTDAALSFQLLYEEKGQGLRCAVSEGICINGSEQHMYQVLDVLLDNALKYGAPNSMVSVKLEKTGHSCLLSVESPGEPIGQEDLKNIFKRFYRADKARTMNGSYGLGLSIAEGIVEAHKGRIWAESGVQTNTFCVQIPMN